MIWWFGEIQGVIRISPNYFCFFKKAQYLLCFKVKHYPELLFRNVLLCILRDIEYNAQMIDKEFGAFAFFEGNINFMLTNCKFIVLSKV